MINEELEKLYTKRRRLLSKGLNDEKLNDKIRDLQDGISKKK
jgi:hypothetical protein